MDICGAKCVALRAVGGTPATIAPAETLDAATKERKGAKRASRAAADAESPDKVRVKK